MGLNETKGEVKDWGFVLFLKSLGLTVVFIRRYFNALYLSVYSPNLETSKEIWAKRWQTNQSKKIYVCIMQFKLLVINIQ